MKGIFWVRNKACLGSHLDTECSGDDKHIKYLCSTDLGSQPLRPNHLGKEIWKRLESAVLQSLLYTSLIYMKCHRNTCPEDGGFRQQSGEIGSVEAEL